MRPDEYKRRRQAAKADERLRRQIAQEAARRMYPTIGPEDESSTLRDASEAEFYAAKRKAAAVLGHRVRPGDLPSDAEVREEVLTLARTQGGPDLTSAPEPEHEHAALSRMSDHIDRFAIYRLRLEPLETVKQNPRTHPEGDALYHSLQVFELARQERPYDEEFLLAALLHDIGKALDPSEPISAALYALDGAIPPRTAWLIEHRKDADSLTPKALQTLGDDPDAFEDLLLLRELDLSGRVPGTVVCTLDEALDYLKGLEAEAYLED